MKSAQPPGRPVVGRTLALALVAAGLALPAVPAQAQAGAAHATRQGQAVQQMEETLLRAAAAKDRTQLERILSDEFEMIVAHEPGNPIDRDAWIDSVAAAEPAPWELEQITVRDLGQHAVASFLLRPAPGTAKARPPVFVVDTWRREGPQWRLLSRHAALALGSRRHIPGDAPKRNVPKKY